MRDFLKILLVVFLLVVSVAFVFNIKINTTNSIDGVLWMGSNKNIEKGDVVLFCPPPNHPVFQMARERHYLNAGFCPSKTDALIKKVYAQQGDVVSINEHGVFVNGVFLEKSIPKKHDNLGKILPIYRMNDFVLENGMLILIGDNSELSFDSRYFGIIDESHVQSVLTPLF